MSSSVKKTEICTHRCLCFFIVTVGLNSFLRHGHSVGSVYTLSRLV